MSELDDRHRVRQAALAGELELRLAALVVSTLETLDEAELRAYHAGAYPLVAGGQRSAAQTAAAYGLTLTRRPGRAPGPVDVTAALASSGVGVTPESRSLVAPVLRARHLVAEGAELVEAKASAASYAGELGTRDLQAAQRVGVEQGAGAGGRRVHGWRKVLSPGACEWCRTVGSTTGRYKAADTVPFHERDRCSVAPVLEA